MLDLFSGEAVMPKGPSKKSNGNGHADQLSSEEVARRAYEIYQSRGGEHGADFDDWLEAEKQLKGQQPKPSAPPERRKRPRAATK